MLILKNRIITSVYVAVTGAQVVASIASLRASRSDVPETRSQEMVVGEEFVPSEGVEQPDGEQPGVELSEGIGGESERSNGSERVGNDKVSRMQAKVAATADVANWTLAFGTISDADISVEREEGVEKYEDPVQIGRSEVGDLINILRTPLADIEHSFAKPEKSPDDVRKASFHNDDVTTGEADEDDELKDKTNEEKDWSMALG